MQTAIQYDRKGNTERRPEFLLLRNFSLLTPQELAELSEVRRVKLASRPICEGDNQKGFIGKLKVALIFWRRLRPIAK